MTSTMSKSFKQLKLEWYSKLKDNGFKDLEDSKGNLYQPNLRTITWQNKERILEFFLSVGSYLNSDTYIRGKDRVILVLWSNGRKLTEISSITGVSYSQIRVIINKHKKVILSKHFCLDITEQ